MVYVIEVDEDGEIRISGMTKDFFLLALNSSKQEYRENFDPIDAKKMRSDVREKDPMSWGDKSILVIEGDILRPRPVSKVTEWEVD